jgi:hypothetical protein
MANLIELIARWRDEGANAGMQKMSVAAGVFTNAIGVGAGLGMIGSIQVLSRAFGNLLRLPFDTATSLGKLTQEMKAGTAVTAEATERYRAMIAVVGSSGVRAFEDLATAQKLAADATRDAITQLAAFTAPAQAGAAFALANMLQGNIPFSTGLGGMPLGFVGGGSPRRDADFVPGTEVTAQRIIGPLATPDQLAAGARWQKIIDDERLAREKLIGAIKATREAREKERYDFEQQMAVFSLQGGVFGPENNPAIAAQQAFERQMDEVAMQGRLIGPETLLESLRATFPEITSLAETAGASVANSLVTIAYNFTNKMQTIGSAAKLFWHSLISDMIAQLTRLALSRLGSWLIGLALGGPVGAVAGAVGGAIGGSRASSPRLEGGSRAGAGGNTYVFQGINTREMYMEVALRGGSIARANDLVRLRAEPA